MHTYSFGCWAGDSVTDGVGRRASSRGRRVPMTCIGARFVVLMERLWPAGIKVQTTVVSVGRIGYPPFRKSAGLGQPSLRYQQSVPVRACLLRHILGRTRGGKRRGGCHSCASTKLRSLQSSAFVAGHLEARRGRADTDKERPRPSHPRRRRRISSRRHQRGAHAHCEMNSSAGRGAGGVWEQGSASCGRIQCGRA